MLKQALKQEKKIKYKVQEHAVILYKLKQIRKKGKLGNMYIRKLRWRLGK